MEVDDDYWDPPDPVQAWKQPPGKPAVSSTFVAWIKLTRIMEMTLRTIVSIIKQLADVKEAYLFVVYDQPHAAICWRH